MCQTPCRPIHSLQQHNDVSSPRYPHFIGGEIEAQRGLGTCPSLEIVGLGGWPRQSETFTRS